MPKWHLVLLFSVKMTFVFNVFRSFDRRFRLGTAFGSLVSVIETIKIKDETLSKYKQISKQPFYDE